MQVTVRAQRADFDSALEAARNVDRVPTVTGLGSPIAADLLGHVGDAWDAIESALAKAWDTGAEAARALADSASAKVEDLMRASGAKAREFHDALMAKLDGYLSEFVERGIARVRSTVTVGEQTLGLSGVELVHTVSFSGSLKASIQEIMALSAAGQMTVSARYSVG